LKEKLDVALLFKLVPTRLQKGFLMLGFKILRASWEWLILILQLEGVLQLSCDICDLSPDIIGFFVSYFLFPLRLVINIVTIQILLLWIQGWHIKSTRICN